MQPTFDNSSSLLTDATINSSTKPTAVGSTWSNAGGINLDIDNLLSGKSKNSGPAPSMNQLKTQSPVKSSAGGGVPSSPAFQANLIGAQTTPQQQRPQYSNIIPNRQNNVAAPASTASLQSSNNLFGNLVMPQQQQQQPSSGSNFNNFNAFQ